MKQINELVDFKNRLFVVFLHWRSFVANYWVFKLIQFSIRNRLSMAKITYSDISCWFICQRKRPLVNVEYHLHTLNSAIIPQKLNSDKIKHLPPWELFNLSWWDTKATQNIFLSSLNYMNIVVEKSFIYQNLHDKHTHRMYVFASNLLYFIHLCASIARSYMLYLTSHIHAQRRTHTPKSNLIQTVCALIRINKSTYARIRTFWYIDISECQK